MSRFYFLRLAVVCASFAIPLRAVASQGDAEQVVRERLNAKGIAIGADSATGRYVYIGICNRILADPASDPKFQRTRRECAEVAELTAKRDILLALAPRINARDEVALRADGGKYERVTTSILEVLSKENLNGASVVASAESWDATTKLYQVAVAIAWTKKLLAASLDTTPHEVIGTDEDQIEWDRWAETIDFSIAVGVRQFTDSRGNRRFAGIGAADIEGKTGENLVKAYDKAQSEAQKSLAFGLYGDFEMQNLATTVMTERESTSGKSTVEAWESFVGRVRARCKKGIRGRAVIERNVVHPITGRCMRVCAFGMTAADQAEITRWNQERMK